MLRPGVLPLLGLALPFWLFPAPALADPAVAAPPSATAVPAPLAKSDGEVARVPAAWVAAASPPAPIRLETYSGHVLLADTVSLAVGFAGVVTHRSYLTTAGVVGYFAAAPLVHRAHGRGKTAAASLGLRVAAPLVAGGIGAGVAAGIYGQDGSGTFREGWAPVVGFAVGGLVGVVAAPILDATLLARTEWFDRLQVVPQISVGSGGGSVGLTGAF